MVYLFLDKHFHCKYAKFKSCDDRIDQIRVYTCVRISVPDENDCSLCIAEL